MEDYVNFPRNSRELKCQEILRLSVAQYFQSALKTMLISYIAKGEQSLKIQYNFKVCLRTTSAIL